MKVFFLFLFVILLLFSESTYSQPLIDEIKFEGLEKTSESYLRLFIRCREGFPLDKKQISQDVQNLRNLTLFSEVSGRSEVNSGKVSVIFSLKETYTLLPVFNFGGINENFWLKAGVTDFNFLGRGIKLGGYYQYYDRHSFEIFTKIPYLAESRWWLAARFGKFSTFEPAYFQNQTSFYNADKYSWQLTAYYDFSSLPGRNIKYIADFGVEYIFEQYEKPVEKNIPHSPGPDYKQFDKYLLRTGLLIKNIDYYFEYLHGYEARLYLESVSEPGKIFNFQKLVTDLRGYYRLTDEINLAARMITGFATNDFSPFLPFVIDSYANVRGSGNRVARGSAELVVNLEIRKTLLHLSWAGFNLISFFDFGSVRPPSESLKQLFMNENIYKSAGAGLRINLYNFYNSVFRFDYGFDLTDRSEGGFVLGFGQYF